MGTKQRQQSSKFIWATLALIIIARTSLIISFGPLKSPDSGLFINQSIALQSFFQGSGAGNYTTFKGTGLGLIILSLKYAFGDMWEWSLIVLQSVMSIIVSWFIGQFAFSVSRSIWVSCLSMLAHSLTVTMSIDLLILRDSLFSSFLAMAILSLAYSAREKQSIGIAKATLVGCLFAFCFMLREQVIYYSVFFVPIAALCVWKKAPLPRIMLLVVLFMLPALGVRSGMISLNEAMAGRAVVSTNARTVMLQALLEVAEKQPQLFGGDSPLDQTARSTFSSYEYDEVVWINRKLMDQGFTDSEIATMAIDKYIYTWKHFPVSILQAVALRFIGSQPKYFLNPGNALLDNLLYASDDVGPYNSSRRTLMDGVRNGKIVNIFSGLLQLVLEPISAILFFTALTAMAMSIYAAIKHKSIFLHQNVLIGCLVAYIGLTFVHALVHVEPRHLAGVIWIPQIFALLSLQNLFMLKNRRRTKFIDAR